MYRCINNIVIPYKIDMGSKGNIMPWHIFKRLFKNVTEEELKKDYKRTYKIKNL